MNKNIVKYFLFFILSFIICESDETVKTDETDKNEDLYDYRSVLRVKQTIMEHASYYNNESITINTSFIDFSEYKFYVIDMNKVANNLESLQFEFYFHVNYEAFEEEGKPESYISIRCIQNDAIRRKCNEILLNEHKFIQFYFDYLITKYGGIVSFMLILIGIFCLRIGYIYYNITTAFYSAFSFFLFCRELCELMELDTDLDVADEKSQSVSIVFYAFTIVTSIGYGYTSIKTRYLKYFSFGFIDGILFAKFFFYIISSAFKDNLLIKYFLTEIICIIAFIIFFFVIRSKYIYINIGNVCIMSSYGIMFGMNILIGGIPFLPFFILSVDSFDGYQPEENLYTKLRDGNKIWFYAGAFVIAVIGGFYLNYSNYKLFIEKKKKNISTL